MTSYQAILFWADAQASSTDVITENNIATKHKPIVMETIGWVIRDDEEGVSICNERFKEGGELQFRGHTFVPRSLVLKIKKARGGKGLSVDNSTPPSV